VLRLGHGVVPARVEGRRQAQPARQLRGLVGKDVAEHVGRHDDVETLRRADQMGRHGIHQFFFVVGRGVGSGDGAHLVEKQSV
jgi:hypothetical protein